MAGAQAFANNDVVQILWRLDTLTPGCLGFQVSRRKAGDDTWVPLPAWVGFEGQSNPNWTMRDTSIWPIQKFEWRDLTAERGQTYSYQIVPVGGDTPGDTPLRAIGPALETAPVTLTPQRGSFATYFNRGILSTQFLAHAVPTGPSGEPNPAILKNRIDQPGDPLRTALAGQLLEGVSLLLKRADAEGGSCLLALYELNDPELVQLLLSTPRLQLILSNAGTNDDTNQAARQALHQRAEAIGDAFQVIDRFVPSGHIGHNKFCVLLDSQGAPTAVLLGSTNWTDTGLCAQSNNALIVNEARVAAGYQRFWQRLREDCANDRARQGPELRTANAHAELDALPIDDGATLTLWCSPNTPKARASKAGPDEPTPPDLSEVFALMSAARRMILFLEFEPGSPSVVDHAAKCLNANPDLYVRGAVTDPKAVGDFSTTLMHRVANDTTVVAASALTDQFAFWQHELLKTQGGHAIIHSKIVVIDPMLPDCMVITGSHNHGYRASYNNDENLLIVRGHTGLAQAYAAHVLDVYDHYRFRAKMNASGDKAFAGLKADDRWQQRYFDSADPASRDLQVWWP